MVISLGACAAKTSRRSLPPGEAEAAAVARVIGRRWTAGGSFISLNDLCFRNRRRTGKIGPTQAAVNAAYAGTNLAGAVSVAGGIQVGLFPTGTYTIVAMGAQGSIRYFNLCRRQRGTRFR